MAMRFSQMHTPNGHLCGEAASALQKTIRRGDERGALYWASELELAGFGNYVWKRLRVIASEDVGLADNSMTLLIQALYDNWYESDKKDTRPGARGRIFLCHAVLALARAPKSRIADHANIVMYHGPRERLEVPDVAIDKHTAAGRRMGRGWRHFFEEGTKLHGQTLPDPFRDDAIAAVAKYEPQEEADDD